MLSRLLLLFILFFSAAIDAQALSPRTCNPVVPKTIKYRPEAEECDGNAGVYLSGRKYMNIFSIVFKKVDHNDRLGDNCPTNACSPFKTQKTIRKNRVRIACFGAPGNSAVFRGYDPFLGYNSSYVVKWISIKVTNSHKLKDVEIYCLPKPYPVTPLN